MSKVTTEDGREAFAAIDAMSRENEATDRGGPWRAALRALTERDTGVDEWDAVPCARRLFRRHADADEREIRVVELHRRRSFVELFSDGNRPADLTDSKIDDAATWVPEHRHRCRTRDGKALVWREMTHDRGRGDGYAASVRETHRDVHRALSGGETTGPTIKGCPWCKEATR